MTTPEYKVGELLDVTLRGVRVTGVLPGELTFRLDAPEYGGHELLVPLSVAEVRRIEPSEGVRLNDLWEDAQGNVWWAVERTDGRGNRGISLTRAGRIETIRDAHNGYVLARLLYRHNPEGQAG